MSLDSSSLRAAPSLAQPVSVEGGGGRRKRPGEGGEGGGEGSSTESQSHMREGMVVKQYVDTVVDSQYVLIEASPPTGVTPEVTVLPQGEAAREKASRPKSKPAKVCDLRCELTVY